MITHPDFAVTMDTSIKLFMLFIVLILDIFLPYFREDFKTKADFNCERRPIPVKKFTWGLKIVCLLVYTIHAGRWFLSSWFVSPWVFEREQHAI